MNARASENYLAISRSSSASKSVEIFWAEIYWGRLSYLPVKFSKDRIISLCELGRTSSFGEEEEEEEE
jgi:hypothetical protein